MSRFKFGGVSLIVIPRLHRPRQQVGNDDAKVTRASLFLQTQRLFKEYMVGIEHRIRSDENLPIAFYVGAEGLLQFRARDDKTVLLQA